MKRNYVILSAMLAFMSAGEATSHAGNLVDITRQPGVVGEIDKISDALAFVNRADLLCARCNEFAKPPQLVNGIAIKPESDPYPQVMMLVIGDETCTATLVGRRTIIAAAHCLPQKEMDDALASMKADAVERQVRVPVARLNGKLMKVKSAFVPAGYKKDADTRDLAVLELEDELLDHLKPISILTSPVLEKSSAVAVGYSPFSSNKLVKNKDGVFVQSASRENRTKKWGKLEIATRKLQYGRLHSVGLMKRPESPPGVEDVSIAEGEKVGLAQQDSGGPLLDDSGRLIGIASGMVFNLKYKPGSNEAAKNFEYSRETQQNLHEDLSSPDNLRFLRRIQELGIPLQLDDERGLSVSSLGSSDLLDLQRNQVQPQRPIQ